MWFNVLNYGTVHLINWLKESIPYIKETIVNDDTNNTNDPKDLEGNIYTVLRI